MINQDLLNRLGPLWKRLKETRFQSNPFERAQEARLLAEGMPRFQEEMMREMAAFRASSASSTFSAVPGRFARPK